MTKGVSATSVRRQGVHSGALPGLYWSFCARADQRLADRFPYATNASKPVLPEVRDALEARKLGIRVLIGMQRGLRCLSQSHFSLRFRIDSSSRFNAR
jgi:hypothetical protein